MSPKLVDLDSAVETLRRDGSDDAMRLAARERLNHPTRNALPRYGAVGLVAGVVLVVAYPRLTAGSAWAQAVESSTGARIIHVVDRDPKGRIFMDEWQQGSKVARTLYGTDGKLFSEWRTDGHALYNFFDFRSDHNGNPNSRVYGHISHYDDPNMMPKTSLGSRLEDLLALRNGKVMSQKPATTKLGEGTLYEVKETYPGSITSTYFVTVDKKSGLVVEMSGGVGKTVASYDYPDTVDESIFEPRPQTKTDLEVYDIQLQSKQIQETMARGLGKSKGVTLRLAALDSGGNLWVLWTGSPVSGRIERGFSIAGAKVGWPYGLSKFTTKADASSREMVDGQQLFGMARSVDTKIGDRVDLRVPAKSGYAEFHDVPVMRIGQPYSYRPWAKKPEKAAVIRYKFGG
ncbi:MAG: hypothetical protein JST12_04065 [Armatimonadetes bacterium]|nr:hypothetical protein [Armatimonadota bacterium]